MFAPIYLVLAIFVFGMNIMPAFMPPTWLVLAFFYTQFHLNLALTVIIGAVCATSGRVILAHLSRSYLRPFLPAKFRKNYEDLSHYFQKNQHLTIPVVITYAFLPIPSNHVFIVAGLTRLKLTLIAFSFLVGRLISYTFWISLAHHVANRLDTLFSLRFSNTTATIFELLGFGLVLLMGMLNWQKILRIKK